MASRSLPVLANAILLLAATGVPGGCAAPVVAVSAGLSAAQAGTAAYVNGELREAAYATIEEVHRAALHALADLEAPVQRERLDEQIGYVMARETGGPEIRVTVRRRTPMLTRIEIRVGVMGDLAVSRVVLARINAHLDPIVAQRLGSLLPQDGFNPER